MTLTTKLTQVIEKNREKINGVDNCPFTISSYKRKLVITYKDWVGTDSPVMNQIDSYFDELPDVFKLTVAMWIIKICPEEFGNLNPYYKSKPEIAHNIWSHWMSYFLLKRQSFKESDYERWWNQSVTLYKDLTTKEQESDQEVADKCMKWSNCETIGEALKQAAYNTCMTYQALEEYYDYLTK